MKTSTFKIEILAPIQEVWKAISTTEGMKAWASWLKIDTNWQVNSSEEIAKDQEESQKQSMEMLKNKLEEKIAIIN